MNTPRIRHVALPLFFLFCACQAVFTQAHGTVPVDPTQQPAASAGTGSQRVAARRVPNFVLPDAAGKQVALADFSDAPVVVVVFLGTKCPIANAYIPELNELQKRYQDKRVQVLGINANPGDS